MGVRDSMLASFELAPATQAQLSVDHRCGTKSCQHRINRLEGKNASIVDEAAVLSEKGVKKSGCADDVSK